MVESWVGVFCGSACRRTRGVGAVSAAIPVEPAGLQGWYGDFDRRLREPTALEPDGRPPLSPTDRLQGHARARQRAAVGARRCVTIVGAVFRLRHEWQSLYPR